MDAVIIFCSLSALLAVGKFLRLRVPLLQKLYLPSSVVGGLVGLIALSKAKIGRFVEIPYGPYICAGCLAWMFFGRAIIGWYVGLFTA
jgi:Na+/glutamate symporter